MYLEIGPKTASYLQDGHTTTRVPGQALLVARGVHVAPHQLHATERSLRVAARDTHARTEGRDDK